MMKLMFYRGPGSIVTKIIRMYTFGLYSHVELQFSNGRRFFASGHGVFKGAHMIRDHKIYGPLWDAVLVPATQEQEDAAQRYAFALIGRPFDIRDLIRFLLPGSSRRRGKYCSAVVMDVLQNELHMFPGYKSKKVSPNGIHRLFLSHKHTLISDSLPTELSPSESRTERPRSAIVDARRSGVPGSPSTPGRDPGTPGKSFAQTWFH
jgi:hypothetical protein